MALVVVIGAGGLTFGLVCPVLTRAGYSVVVASRIVGSECQDRLDRVRQTRQVRVTSMRGEPLETVALAGFVDTGTQAGLVDLETQLADADVALFVTAARGGFDTLQSRVQAAARQRGTPLVALCADNSPPPGWYALASLEVPMLVCSPTIADRICLRFPERFDHADVMVEDHWSWVVQADACGSVSQAFTGVPDVTVVGDVTPWRVRKLLCVNGLQLALAVAAQLDGYPELNLWIEDHYGEAEEVAAGLADAFAELSGEDRVAVSEFCTYSLTRFATSPDSSGRIVGLQERQEYGDPDDLAYRVHERIEPLEPFDAYGVIRQVLLRARHLADAWANHNP